MRVSIKSLAAGLVLTLAFSGQGRVIAQGQRAPQMSSAEVEGVLEVFVDDERERTIIHYFLETAEGRIRLREAPGGSGLKGMESGTRVRVRGSRGSDGSFELALAGGNTSSVTTVALASPNTFGPQRVAVILVNFQDNTAAPYGWAHAADVTFNQTNAYFSENSYGQTSLYGDVFGWYTIPMTSVCDHYQIASLADQAVANAGVNLNSYSRKVYAFPQISCAWWGKGSVGGNPSRAWVNGTYNLKVVSHELGHNFGDWHSNALPCEGSTCTHVEYGDDRDTMGQVGTGHMHAYQKERLGWLNYGVSPSIQTVTASGLYWINSLQVAGASPKALKIRKSTSSSAGNVNYYVEARTQFGFDAGYPSGVLLHTGNEIQGNSAYQVDLDPITSGFDTMLDAGQTFSDPAALFTIRTVSADENGAWVEITIGGSSTSPCTTSAPEVSMTPTSVAIGAGAGINYSISIRNADQAGCEISTFSAAMAVPAGWSWSSNELSRTLAPGDSGNIAVTVTSSTSASGTSQVTANISRSTSGAGGSATGSVSITATPTPVPTGPISATLETAVNAQSQAVMKVTVLDAGVGVANAQVTYVVRNPLGAETTLVAATDSKGIATAKLKLKPRDPRGTWTVSVSATSGARTATAAGSFVY